MCPLTLPFAGALEMAAMLRGQWQSQAPVPAVWLLLRARNAGLFLRCLHLPKLQEGSDCFPKSEPER